MWVTQTYLGVVEPDAQLYVYYLFENYKREQKAFTDRIQQELVTCRRVNITIPSHV
jgi:hypothetical protein